MTSVIDINMVAIYLMIKGDPGIKKARLYKGKHGQEIFDRMVSAGLIKEEGNGCFLTGEGEMIGVCMKAIVDAMGGEEEITAYVDGLVDWYQQKIDLNRVRNRR